MTEIENTDLRPVRRGVTAKTVSMGMMALALCGTLIIALPSAEASSWAIVCVPLAIVLATLSTPPTLAIIERHQQPVQIVAGGIAIAASVFVFRTLQGVGGVLLGFSTVCAGVATLIPGMWPASRTKLPRLFGGTR